MFLETFANLIHGHNPVLSLNLVKVYKLNHAISELINKWLTTAMRLSEKISGLLVHQNPWLFKTETAEILAALFLFSPRQPVQEDNGGGDDAECEDHTEVSGGKGEKK